MSEDKKAWQPMQQSLSPKKDKHTKQTPSPLNTRPTTQGETRKQMIKRIRITSESSPLFLTTWQLYCNAFPKEEVRPMSYHAAALSKEAFHADALLDAETDQFIGLLFWWDLHRVRYIEHLATAPTLRGKGSGKEALEQFINENDKPILLEVEHPDCEIATRRINFYKRLGFALSPLAYKHPPYWAESKDFVSLAIMTTQGAITAEELQHFVKEEHPLIHFRHPFHNLC